MGDCSSGAKPAAFGATSDEGALHVAPAGHSLHPAWRAFIRFCGELRHGQIEELKVQDGLPLLAEVTKKKVKFT